MNENKFWVCVLTIAFLAVASMFTAIVLYEVKQANMRIELPKAGVPSYEIVCAEDDMNTRALRAAKGRMAR